MKPSLPEAVFQQHIAVLGKTRSGKSSVMRLLTEHLLEQKIPVCIVDPKGDWWGIKLARDGKRPGHSVVIFGGAHADVPITAHDGAGVAELFATGNRPCLIDLGGWMPGERTRFWIDFASTLFRNTRGERTLVVDEIHNFAPKGKVMDPDSGKALHWTNRLASEGLGKGLAMMFASQRPQKVHNDTLTSAETLIAMRVLHPSDRAAVADWVKGCGDPTLGGKVLDSLAQMQRGEGWAWSPEVGFGPERVKFPLFKTYDSFRPQSTEDTKALKGWAEVDLEEVKAKLAAAVEHAKANDPAALKRTIVQLQRDLQQAQASKLVGKQEVKGERVEVPVLKDSQIKRLEALFNRMQKEAERHGAAMSLFWGNQHESANALLKALISVNQSRPPHDREIGRPALTGAASGRAFPRGAPNHSPAPAPLERRATPAPAVNGEVKGGAFRSMLVALAQAGRPLRDNQVAARAGMALSGTFDKYLGQQRTSGWVEGSRSDLRITAEGLQALGPYDPLPTGVELQKYWLNYVGAGAKSHMLLALIEVYPEALPDAELARRAEMALSGTFDKYLGQLRTLQLVTGSRQALRASEELFT